jgi:DNA polymerase III epsilon subunit-like protein
MYLIFDTETTGLPKKYTAPISDTDNWPRCIQIAWQLHDDMGRVIEHQDYLVKPEGFNIPYNAERIHGISTELAEAEGIPLAEVLEKFNVALSKTKFIVGHNLGFDVNIMGCEFYRLGVESTMGAMPVLDTMTDTSANLLKLPGGRGGKFKFPTLSELHSYLFNKPFSEAHNATADVEATTRCFFELIRTEVFTKKELEVEQEYFEDFQLKNPREIQLIGLQHINLKEAFLAKKDNLSKRIESSNYIKGEFVDDKEFSELLNTVCNRYRRLIEVPKHYMFISGFKLAKDDEGNDHMMMQLVQIREMEHIEDNRLFSLLDSHIFSTENTQKRVLKVWLKVTVRGFEKLFGDVNGKINISEIHNQLKDYMYGYILAFCCRIKTVYVDGKEEIPLIIIKQISNRKKLPIKILKAISSVNYKLRDTIFDDQNGGKYSYSELRREYSSLSDIEFEKFIANWEDDLFLNVCDNRKNVSNDIDEILLKEAVMITSEGYLISDSKGNVIFELPSLSYGNDKDVVIENKKFGEQWEDDAWNKFNLR